MADLVTTLSESVTLNGSLRGSTNSVTTTGIVDVFERIVTCTQAVVTTIGVFAALPSTSPGAIDVDRTRYVRVTNLDTNNIELAIVTTASNYQVTLTAGNSHILCLGSSVARGEEDTTPGFLTLQDITSLQVKPVTANDAQVELFVGLV
jgi:hypothetical protein|tara:strand:+ start:299 stop:745 length:447 start_codon:yes stop_codon:yes gene_type:complete